MTIPNRSGIERFASEQERVEKPWGHELIFAVAESYVGKLIFVKAGESLSLQFHKEKDEAWYVLEGRAEVELGAPGESILATEVVGPGASFRFPPGPSTGSRRSRTRPSSRSRRRSSTTSSGSKTATGVRAEIDTGVLRLSHGRSEGW